MSKNKITDIDSKRVKISKKAKTDHYKLRRQRKNRRNQWSA